MRKLFWVIFSFAVCTVALGQDEKSEYKVVIDKFTRFYNENACDSVFALFGPQMQTALPLEKTTDFLSGMKGQAGNLQERRLLRYQGAIGIYRVVFERAEFDMAFSLDENSKINGLVARPPEADIPVLKRNETAMALPFSGKWFVFWGGDTPVQNYHAGTAHKGQKNAFDFIIMGENGKSFRTDGRTNEDYYAFGKEITALCDGEVVMVVDGIPDNVPGRMNPIFAGGNSVMVKTAKGEYIFMAHFKNNSMKVKAGDKVKTGQFIGLCGNSGNSSEAHLHLHLQNIDEMDIATGMKCFFSAVSVNGEAKIDYSPVKGDTVENK